VGGDELHRPLELGAAVAAQGVQGVACQELRVDADEGDASYTEIGHELMTDPEFRSRWQRRGRVVWNAIREWVAEQRGADPAAGEEATRGLLTYSAIVLDGTLLQLRLGTAPEDLAPRIRLDGETARR
jgi:hypothetical protein